MRHLIRNVAIAATITSLFVFVGALATAVARAETETYAVSSTPFLPIQTLEAAY
jgi:hypothetical protein